MSFAPPKKAAPERCRSAILDHFTNPARKASALMPGMDSAMT